MQLVPVMLIVLASFSAVQVVAWIIFGIRAWADARQAPFVRDSLDRALRAAAPGPTWPRVSIVVPAHNEERVARACAESILASDYPALDVVFVLDRCTDGTRASLQPLADADPRLRIIENHTCPDDWAGKCNAARVGEAATDGELVLFTDADTHFHPQLVKASVALLRERNWRMLSLFSAPTHDHWFENIVQPVASIALLKLFPIRRANAPKDRRAFANGQFMLFERAAYRELGGHEAVKGDLLEDMGFARRMKTLDMPQGVGVGGGMLVVSMYDSWKNFRAGWKRIYIECCVRNPARLRRQAAQLLALGPGLAAVWLASVAMSVAIIAGVCPDAPDMWHDWAWATLWLALAAWVIGKFVMVALYRTCSFPLWSPFLWAFSSAAVAAIFLEGARDLKNRTPVRWGGKQYVLETTDY